MVAAMVKAGSADPAKYLPVLAKTEGYKGVTGVISFDNKGDIKNGALTWTRTRGRNGHRRGALTDPLHRLFKNARASGRFRGRDADRSYIDAHATHLLARPRSGQCRREVRPQSLACQLLHEPAMPNSKPTAQTSAPDAADPDPGLCAASAGSTRAHRTTGVAGIGPHGVVDRSCGHWPAPPADTPLWADDPISVMGTERSARWCWARTRHCLNATR